METKPIKSLDELCSAVKHNDKESLSKYSETLLQSFSSAVAAVNGYVTINGTNLLKRLSDKDLTEEQRDDIKQDFKFDLYDKVETVANICNEISQIDDKILGLRIPCYDPMSAEKVNIGDNPAMQMAVDNKTSAIVDFCHKFEGAAGRELFKELGLKIEREAVQLS